MTITVTVRTARIIIFITLPDGLSFENPYLEGQITWWLGLPASSGRGGRRGEGGPNGPEWARMGPNGPEWPRMGPNGPRMGYCKEYRREIRPNYLFDYITVWTRPEINNVIGSKSMVLDRIYTRSIGHLFGFRLIDVPLDQLL